MIHSSSLSCHPSVVVWQGMIILRKQSWEQWWHDIILSLFLTHKQMVCNFRSRQNNWSSLILQCGPWLRNTRTRTCWWLVAMDRIAAGSLNTMEKRCHPRRGPCRLSRRLPQFCKRGSICAFTRGMEDGEYYHDAFWERAREERGRNWYWSVDSVVDWNCLEIPAECASSSRCNHGLSWFRGLGPWPSSDYGCIALKRSVLGWIDGRLSAVTVKAFAYRIIFFCLLRWQS